MWAVVPNFSVVEWFVFVLLCFNFVFVLLSSILCLSPVFDYNGFASCFNVVFCDVFCDVFLRCVLVLCLNAVLANVFSCCVLMMYLNFVL